MKKVLLGLLCVILAGLLGFGILQSKRRDQAQARALEQISAELTSLRSRKIELEAELTGIKKENDELASGMATLSMLVTDLSAGFMERITQPLEAGEIPAVMALSQEQMPGERDIISLEGFQQRLDSGWDYCAAWNGVEDFEIWYADIAERLAALELAMPEVLYCAERSYTAEVEAAAMAKGITVIVHSGEKNLPIVDEEFGKPWKPGSIRWVASGAQECLEEVIEKHGSMAFVLDSVDFNESEFNSMLELTRQCRSEETLMAATFAEAKKYREERIAQNEKLQDEAYEGKILELKNEIEAVNTEIQSLLNK